MFGKDVICERFLGIEIIEVDLKHTKKINGNVQLQMCKGMSQKSMKKS